MSASLKRALGLWVAAQVPVLHVYADDLANTKYRYPACSVGEILRSLSPVGCGKKDFTVRHPDTGWVTASGRMHREETTYRLVVSAPAGFQQPGQETVDALLDQVEQAVLATQSDPAPVVLTDTEVDPVGAFPLEALRLAGRQPVPPDTTGEPFLNRGALSLRVIRLVPFERAVEHVMEHIHVEDEGQS
jgi:hypothetical protein